MSATYIDIQKPPTQTEHVQSTLMQKSLVQKGRPCDELCDNTEVQLHLNDQGVVWEVALPLLFVWAKGQCHAVGSRSDNLKLRVASKAVLSFDWAHVSKLREADRHAAPVVAACTISI